MRVVQLPHSNVLIVVNWRAATTTHDSFILLISGERGRNSRTEHERIDPKKFNILGKRYISVWRIRTPISLFNIPLSTSN
jgi:hypothetical protein